MEKVHLWSYYTLASPIIGDLDLDFVKHKNKWSRVWTLFRICRRNMNVEALKQNNITMKYWKVPLVISPVNIIYFNVETIWVTK